LSCFREPGFAGLAVQGYEVLAKAAADASRARLSVQTQPVAGRQRASTCEAVKAAFRAVKKTYNKYKSSKIVPPITL
jgi:hypothetical protein